MFVRSSDEDSDTNNYFQHNFLYNFYYLGNTSFTTEDNLGAVGC